jgi:PKHD-type hydroxylase
MNDTDKNSLFRKIVRNILSKDECERLIKRHKSEAGEMAKFWSGEKRIEVKSTRDSRLVWVGHDLESEISSRVMSEMPGHENLFFKDKIQLTHYAVGGHYVWHPDYVQKHNPRKYSAAILLSDRSEFAGGEFEFRDIDFKCDLNQGDAIIFDARLWHRVTPVTSGERYSAVLWALDVKDKPE